MSTTSRETPPEDQSAIEDQIKTINLMSTADAVMSHWQVSQAFMRMAKRSKKNEIKVAFLRAEQQIIQDLYENLTETQLSEKKKANKFSSSSIINLRERPAELARLAEYFPLTLLSVYSYGRAWNIKLFCDKCKQFVKLTDLRIYELCAKHHECVALHCVPKRDDFQLLLDPLSVVEHFRRIAMIRSEDDDRNGGDEGKLEHFFDRAMYDDVLHNMSTLSQLVQTRSITFEESDLPALPKREGLAILRKEDGIER